jgi:hypothetical protein
MCLSYFLDTLVKALYLTDNWAFIEINETKQTGYVPIYCLRSFDIDNPLTESSSQNNISLLNVSIYDKPHLSVRHHRCHSTSTPSSGCFVSSIGVCHINHEQQPPQSMTCSRSIKTKTFRRTQKDQSILSRQISNMSLHAYDHDAYGTLNVTPGKSLSFSVLDNDSIVHRRLRAIESYQKKFIGDISILESEVLTLLDTEDSMSDWHLVRRGDGRQGYVPKHVLVFD